jgi:hypothetical protein
MINDRKELPEELAQQKKKRMEKKRGFSISDVFNLETPPASGDAFLFPEQQLTK